MGQASRASLLHGVSVTAERPVRLVACPDCDALITLSASNATLRCPRCHCVLVRHASGIVSALALYLTAGVCFMVANLFPIVQISAGGIVVHATLFGAARALSAEHMQLMALVVISTTVVVPAIELLCMTSLLLLAESRYSSSTTLQLLFRARTSLSPWNMVEIFVLGILVAVVKLGSLASVVLGIGAWSLAAFMLAHTAASHAFEPREFWNELEEFA